MPVNYQQTKLRGYLCVKYSSIKHIDKSVKGCLEDLINNYFISKKYDLVWLSVGDESTEIIFEYPQTVAVIQIIKSLKSSTSRLIRESFPETLGKQKTFWIDGRSRADLRKNYIFISLNPYENPIQKY